MTYQTPNDYTALIDFRMKQAANGKLYRLISRVGYGFNPQNAKSYEIDWTDPEQNLTQRRAAFSVCEAEWLIAAEASHSGNGKHGETGSSHVSIKPTPSRGRPAVTTTVDRAQPAAC